MTDLSRSDVQSRTLTAFFDTRDAAQKATDDLTAAGVPHQQILLTEGSDTTAVTDRAVPTRDKNFWDELKDLFLPDEDRSGYAEGLRRGGFLLTVRTEDGNYNRVLDILDRDGAVDMDEREASWRTSGWSGYDRTEADPRFGVADAADLRTAAVGTMPATDATAGGAAVRQTDLTAPAPQAAPTSRATSNPTDALQAGGEEVIPVYEETARVAKRDVDHGRVRLRSYVVETPVNEQVSLRNEQVQVERRPVDRPVAAGDAVFQDRVIEAAEHREEAVLTKEARVKEEIALSKTVEQQNQTVSGTVRRTEVEVDDQRGGRGLGLAGDASAASRITEHMPVLASDGTQIGTVDHMDGPDTIKLAKTTSPDGEHHYVPVAWIDHVDTHVHLNKSSAAVKAEW